MTEQEAIELHIQENLHRISAIESFLSISPDADGKECHKNISVLMKVNGLLQEIQQYRAIGTAGECREAMERQREKKPVKDKYNRDCCPDCGWIVCQDEYGGRYLPHCENCGQAIDWSGIE